MSPIRLAAVHFSPDIVEFFRLLHEHFEEAWPERVEATLVTPEGDIVLPYIAIDQLIANKRAAGRPKDLDDLAYLEAAKKEKR